MSRTYFFYKPVCDPAFCSCVELNFDPFAAFLHDGVASTWIDCLYDCVRLTGSRTNIEIRCGALHLLGRCSCWFLLLWLLLLLCADEPVRYPTALAVRKFYLNPVIFGGDDGQHSFVRQCSDDSVLEART
ncbi:hypothetical protein DES34_11459 [Brevibacillus brevis]|nr:hypothetical protein DES34_11459 [Brevibacillus brevis]VEF90303.1 Uncharacterised protein [Brevibacillus brevis]